ncbi:MAG TPA: hypothetical protein VIW73_09140 [Candidatus Cybelea sp.]
MLAVAESIRSRVVAIADRIGNRGAGNLVATCIDSFSDTSWPAVAWKFSGLTAEGCPLEFEFSTSDDRLRFVTEVAPPEAEHHARLDAAAGLIERLRIPAPPAHEIDFWKAFQSARRLRWGAWLGVRHDGHSAQTKLYIEVPPELRDPAAAGLVQAIVPSGRIMMAGYDCASGAREYYFRQPQMDASERLAFLRCIGETARRQVVLDAFAELSGLPLRAALDWIDFGYSITRGPSADERFSIFVELRSARPASRIRRTFLRWEERAGRSASAYRDLVGALADERLPSHGILSVNADGAGAPELRVAIGAAALTGL